MTVNVYRATNWIALILLLSFLLAYPAGLYGENTSKLKTDFQEFLGTYIEAVKIRDKQFLGTIHPNLPEDMYEFFFDVTQNMMSFAQEEGLAPDIECREYNVCKVTWPQPGDSWAAQTFIRHEGKWRWLEP